MDLGALILIGVGGLVLLNVFLFMHVFRLRKEWKATAEPPAAES